MVLMKSPKLLPLFRLLMLLDSSMPTLANLNGNNLLNGTFSCLFSRKRETSFDIEATLLASEELLKRDCRII